VRYRCLHRRRTLYPIRLMCRLLKVSSSGYYAWRVRPESERARANRALTQAVRRIHAQSDGTYGSPRIHAQLRSEGLRCGRSRVARLMRDARLKGCPKRRFRVGSKPAPAKVANLLDQDFSASGANQRWAADITYLSTREGWLYLAVVMDLYSRRIIGWSMHRRIDRALALAALDMALGRRQPLGI
jgi:putative transposase